MHICVPDCRDRTLVSKAITLLIDSLFVLAIRILVDLGSKTRLFEANEGITSTFWQV